jgi:hypothetical protein
MLFSVSEWKPLCSPFVIRLCDVLIRVVRQTLILSLPVYLRLHDLRI